ncbi:MAG: hypothetical protein E4H01_00145 [Lysobacterales bacterium]|nr:MAG: hypothetical protein E4H01_00145 [Xanthomonadales bacterium]
MNETLDIPRGFTGAFTKAGIGIGSTPAELSTAAPDGTGVNFAIDGLGYYKVDDASTASTPGALPLQAADTECLYMLCVDAALAMTVTKGVEVLTTDIAKGAALFWPEPTANTCPFGGFRMATVAVTFTGGTTDLDAAGCTATYYDFLGGQPSGPIVA